MNPINTRLLSQQLAAPQFDNPEEVVAHFGAMQAQDYRMMRWAVEMRTRKPSHEAFRQAFDEGRIVRLHLLRGTWQLVSATDHQWMMQLCAPKALKVIKGWMSANRISISDEEHEQVSTIFAQEATRLGSATKEDFAEALARHGLEFDDHRVSYHIRFAELSGLLCSGDLLPMKATYSLAAQKIAPQPAIDRNKALARLARKYFQSHSPATLEDFVWWSGLTASDCRKGMQALGTELSKANIGGCEFLIHDSCRTTGCHKQTHLLPPYDEYLIGYKSRHVALPPEHQHHAHSNNGIFYPVVLHDGKVVGNWSPYKEEHVPTFFVPQEAPSTNKAWTTYQKYKQH